MSNEGLRPDELVGELAQARHHGLVTIAGARRRHGEQRRQPLAGLDVLGQRLGRPRGQAFRPDADHRPRALDEDAPAWPPAHRDQPVVGEQREGLGDRRAGDVELLLQIGLEPQAIARAHLALDDAGLDGAPDRLWTGVEVGNGFAVSHDRATG